MIIRKAVAIIILINFILCAFSQNQAKWIIQPVFDSAQDFLYGVAVVEIAGKYGAINSDGDIIIPIKYKENSSKLKSLLIENRSKNIYGRKKIQDYEIISDSKDEKWGYRKSTLKDYLDSCIESWESYQNKKSDKIGKIQDYLLKYGIASYEEYLKLNIEKDINSWQKKGEFETMAKWEERVNDRTRILKIDELTKKYNAKYMEILNEYKNIYEGLLVEYKNEYSKCREYYYEIRILDNTFEFNKSEFVLMSYDADNETYLVKSDLYGDMLFSVPIEEAPDFKRFWRIIKRNIVPHFVPSGDDVVLTSVTITNGNKKYVYDSHTQAKYAVTDINYNFDPVEISIPEVADVNYTFDPVEVIQSTVVQTSLNVKGLEANNTTIERRSIDATTQSDVDINIPQNTIQKNSNTFVVIIANEDYQRVSDVQYANNDGKLFAEYCQKTLGLPQNHVMVYNDATLGNMLGAVSRIKEIGEAYNGKVNVVLYYAGHGIPDETSKDAYLLPVDGDGSSVRTCYKQSELYSELASIKAESIVVFMDACFSGSLRGDGMLASARGVAIKAKKSNPVGNMVVFSAAQGDETAYPYKEQRHGMFTYYLLKKLQETKGEATLGEISDYVTREVRKQSIVINGKMQTPTLTSSSAVGDAWRNWKLK